MMPTFNYLQREDFNNFVSQSELCDDVALTKDIVHRLFIATKARISKNDG